jgi:hypothetical protein
MSEEHPDLTLAYMTGYAKGRAVAERDAKDAARYRYVRRLSPRAFSDLYFMNISSSKPFDELIDAAMSAETTKPNHIGDANNMVSDALTDKTDWKELK